MTGPGGAVPTVSNPPPEPAGRLTRARRGSGGGSVTGPGSWIPSWDLITTKQLELRKRRGLMVAVFLLTIGLPVLVLGLRLAFHAFDPRSYGPAGSPSVFAALCNPMAEFGFIIAASVLAALGRVVRIVVVACGNAQARLDRITGSARERISSAPAFPRTGRMAVLVMASAAVLFAFGTSASRSVTPSVTTASTSPTPTSRTPSPAASPAATRWSRPRR